MGKYDTYPRSEAYSPPARDERALNERAPGSDVTDEQLRADDTNPASWLQYNKGPRQLGYSPASRITPENVGQLELEYFHGTEGRQFNPIVVPSGDGEPPVMYFPRGQGIRAINARTGDEYWRFDYSPERGGGARNRGVSVWGDKVYLAAADCRLVAVDRYTGEKQWTSRFVSERQREEMTPGTGRLGSTGAPLVFDGTVYKGQSGQGNGWGAIVAIDAETGDVVWDYDVIPKDHWVGETWRFGDGAPWTTPSIDPVSETIFVPTGNPGPMLNGAVRPGPNRHTDSVVALDANTGEERWTHQLVAQDWWDYDNYLTRVFDLEVGGETRRVVQTEDKTGWIYVIDAETGQLLRRSEPHANQGAELPFMAIPPAGEENAKEKSPSAMGGTDWHPDGYSPKTGLVYIGSSDDYKDAWYDPDWQFHPDSYESSIGGGRTDIHNPDSGEKAARVTAINPETGEIVWTTPYDTTRTPFWPGGNTPTGGNLVFAGNNGGQFRALHAETGDVLWEERSTQQYSASPVVWDDPEVGKGYVAIASRTVLSVYSVEGEPSDAPGGVTGSRTDDTDTPGASGLGFGAAAGAGGAAYAAKKLRDRDEADETGGESEDDLGSEGDDRESENGSHDARDR